MDGCTKRVRCGGYEPPAVGDEQGWVLLHQVIGNLSHAQRAAVVVRVLDKVIDGLELLGSEPPRAVDEGGAALATVAAVHDEHGAVGQKVLHQRRRVLVLRAQQIVCAPGQLRDVDAWILRLAAETARQPHG